MHTRAFRSKIGVGVKGVRMAEENVRAQIRYPHAAHRAGRFGEVFFDKPAIQPDSLEPLRELI